MAARFARPIAVGAAVLAGVVITGGAAIAVTRSYADPSPVPAAISSADPDALASRTYLIDCDHEPVVRPASFVLSCADANSAIEPATWAVWGGSAARGTGEYVENDCTPDCASGSFRSYPVSMTADNLARVDGLGRYRRVELRFTGAAPGWVKRRTAQFDVDFFERS